MAGFLQWGDFTRKTDEWGNQFLEFNERTTKTCQGLGDTHPIHPKMWASCRNPERCTLYLYKEYERHRPYDMREPDSPFYLGVNLRGPHLQSVGSRDNPWANIHWGQ